MRILAIETSCDETAIALIECSGGLTAPKFKILKNAVASQVAIHAPFGGVVPNLAKREHIKNLPILYRNLFGLSPTRPSEAERRRVTSHLSPDLIAVTSGPGLEPALWAGINFAQQLQKDLSPNTYHLTPPLVGANHLEGHLYSFLLAQKSRGTYLVPHIKDLFPAIGIIASGGHTCLMLLKDLKTRKKLGETRDDAIGEAFDKVARILGLPYPGGPEVEKLALRQSQGKHPHGTIAFPRPMLHDKNYDFSYSGLKTAVLYYVRDHLSPITSHLSPQQKADVAASFQEAAIDVLAKKALRAADEFGARSLLLSGGVAANQALRERLAREAKSTGRTFLVAEFKHNTDNAVMIAVAAYINYLKGKKYPLIANGALNIK